MNCRKAVVCVLVAMLLGCVAATAQAELITNGDFTTDLTGWSGGAWDIGTTGYTSPGGTLPSAAIISGGTLSQSNGASHPFSTGETYTVSFWASYVNGSRTFTAALKDSTTGGTTVAFQDITLPDGVYAWSYYSFLYPVESTRVNDQWSIEFSNTSNGWIRIDQVSVNAAIPEPTTIYILLSGVIGLLCYAWRKQR